MTTPSVQYVYADGSNNTIRPTAVVYPNGRTLHANYGTPGGMDDAASRVAALIDDDGTTHLADYSYLGLGSPVVVDYTQPQIKFTLVGTTGGNDPNTGDIYHGLDRFGRVKDAYWRNHGNNSDAARIQYGYDRASNRTHRHDPVAAAATAKFDELYQYDAIHRLKEMQRGTLNGPKTGLTAESFAQCWSLDPTGNWKGFRQDDTGSGTWDLVQARTANPVNEITGISETAGPSWTTPAYDAAGNMTTVPQPVDPTTSYAATYDAWNRLTKLMNGSDLVQENQYDARNFRNTRKDYTAGVLAETRHFYYTSGWQCLEERLGSSPASAAADRQQIWGLRYIDDLILRDRFHSSHASSSSSSGSPAERLYAIQDGNWNVIALSDALGTIQERFAYTAYGVPLFLNAAFVQQPSSASEWETLYAGYRHDHATGLQFVRYRILHAILGCWTTRDPLPITREWDLLSYVFSQPLNQIDPFGLDPFVFSSINPSKPVPPYSPSTSQTNIIDNQLIPAGLKGESLSGLISTGAEGQISMPFPGARQYLRTRYRSITNAQLTNLSKGCIGITEAMMGRVIRFRTNIEFKWCYNSFEAAMKERDAWRCEKRCLAEIFAFRWPENADDKKRRSIDNNTQRILWNGTSPQAGGMDFGYYDAMHNAFWHATGGVITSPEKSQRFLLSKKETFTGGDRSTVYCVLCPSTGSMRRDEFSKSDK